MDGMESGSFYPNAEKYSITRAINSKGRDENWL